MKLAKSLISGYLILMIVLLNGCASIVSKSDYPVSFNSSPEGAIITITNSSGIQLYKGKTPTQVTLKSSEGFFSGAKYTVKFEKEGYEPQIMVLEKQLDGWYIGNILFGGLIGLLIVDPATGAMWKLPSNMHASLAEKTTALIIGENNLRIAFLDDVPASMRSQMIRVQ
ncbi:peptidase associated/transthyretin-like domain-containing protein [Geothermobacter ehrlichii]|uniref:hypothetical protein n=1 Tax=Geothermobacter ehrlichii TaxID=213224 RepID=UPI0016531DB4|nr:hypothetical protein [Geothermobacter ehrlichii]